MTLQDVHVLLGPNISCLLGANLAPSNAPKTKQRYASSLCTAPGLGKVIPAVINTKLGSLYEEPALNYICIELHKVGIDSNGTVSTVD